MAWASVAVGAIGVGSSIYKGLKSKSKDKQAAAEGASLKRPSERIPDEYFQDRNIAEQQATGGLSAGEKQYAGEQRERGIGSSLEALKETGGGPNEFAGLSKVFDDSLKSQSAQDAQLHMQNIKFFTDTNSELAGQKTTQWGVNELQPYESKLKEIQDRRIAAQTNENNAVDEGLGYAAAGITAFNSRNNDGSGKDNTSGGSSSPYSRTFGISNTSGGDPGSPAAGFNVLNPNAADGVLAG